MFLCGLRTKLFVALILLALAIPVLAQTADSCNVCGEQGMLAGLFDLCDPTECSSLGACHFIPGFVAGGSCCVDRNNNAICDDQEVQIVEKGIWSETPKSAPRCTLRIQQCEEGEVLLYRLSDTTNAHIELPSSNNYGYALCCYAFDAPLDTSCNDEMIMKISDLTDAHGSFIWKEGGERHLITCGDGDCKEGETCEFDFCCNGQEVDFSSNNNHCGACNSPCDSGKSCSGGVCE